MCDKAVWLLIRSRLQHFTSSSHCLVGFEMNQPAKTNISLSLSLFCTELASDIQVKEESQSPAPAASSHVPLAVTIVVLVAAVLVVGGFLLKHKLQEPIPDNVRGKPTLAGRRIFSPAICFIIRFYNLCRG